MCSATVKLVSIPYEIFGTSDTLNYTISTLNMFCLKEKKYFALGGHFRHLINLLKVFVANKKKKLTIQENMKQSLP